jgi:hypothetical protein
MALLALTQWVLSMVVPEFLSLAGQLSQGISESLIS